MDILNKDWDTEEMDASMTSEQENKFSSPFDNQDTQTEIVMTKRKDADSTLLKNQIPMNGVYKSITALQNWLQLV